LLLNRQYLTFVFQDKIDMDQEKGFIYKFVVDAAMARA